MFTADSRADLKNYQVKHYNLDAIIAVGSIPQTVSFP
jgi:hypothetical protein